MPRCPLCASAYITIVIRSLHPLAFCSSCGARWTQDGSEQSAIKRVPPPALFTSTTRQRQPQLRNSTGHRDTSQLLPASCFTRG